MPTDFDTRAETWDDDEEHVAQTREAAVAIRARVGRSASLRLLDYGAGTGLLAEALATDLAALTLAEPSAGMRAQAAAKVRAGRLPASTRIWELDLTRDPVPDERFDVIVSVLTLHHIHDLARVLGALAAMLEPGGRLCIVDLEEEDGTFHDAESGFDGHHGFAEHVLRALLHDAGLVEVSVGRLDTLVKDGRPYHRFLAVARRAPASGS